MQVPFDGFASAGGSHEPGLFDRTVGAGRVHGDRHGARARSRATWREGTGLSTTDSVIVWTDEELLVLGRAVRGDAADLTLYEWWRNESGPVGTVRAAPEGRRAAETPRGCVRASRMTLDVSDRLRIARRSGTRRATEVRARPLRGRSCSSRSPDTLLLCYRLAPQRSGGICPNYEVYRWRLRGERLDLRLLSGGCREYSSAETANAEWTRVG